MRPNYDESLSFLKLIYPTGPWMLTAISVDKKSITARTFLEGEEESLLKWLDLHGTYNLYYSVNQPVEHARSKIKLAKTEVATAHFVHVDVDPRAGENVVAEQERILKQLDSYTIEPSFVVFSGGGYNALWALRTPVPIAQGATDEREAASRALDFERRNWQMELDFKTPDHCRDVSRILRLPGTLNRPNQDKIDKGRTLQLSRLVHATGLSYPLSVFMATPIVNANTPAATRGSKHVVTQDAVRVESLDHLPRTVADTTKVMIAQGFDPAKKDWDGDRSDALFRVCCDLVRAGCDDATILGVITDPRYLISASVLDKGQRMMPYALRQIGRARDMADHPMLADLNERFAIITNLGASTVVMDEEGVTNPVTQKMEPVFKGLRDLKIVLKKYPPIEIEFGDKKKRIPVYEWWTSHPRRREYREVCFEPDMETTDRYNLWKGFNVDAIPGDKHLRLLTHVRDNICDGDEELYDYLIRWMARAVQQPRTQSMTAIVLLGDRGTGKSIFCDFFASVFEPHVAVVSDTEQLTGKFSADVSTALMVVAEEAFDLKDKRHESVLKHMITGKTARVEKKNVDAIRLPNYAKFMMTSNVERVVPAGDKERRFVVIRVASHQIQNRDYFMPILEDQRSGGVANLLHYLKTIDLSEFDVTRVPQTDELRRQQEYNFSAELDWLLTKLETGVWIDGHQRWEGPVFKRELHTDYVKYMSDHNVRSIRRTRAFHLFIMQSLPGTTDKQLQGKDAHDRKMAFFFPSLEECRRQFDRARGWEREWPMVEPSPVAEVLEMDPNKKRKF